MGPIGFHTQERAFAVEVLYTKPVLQRDLLDAETLSSEEGKLVLQIVTWVFEASCRRAKLRNLGRRAHQYEIEPDKVRPIHWQRTFHTQNPDRQLPPRVWLYRGWAPRILRVAVGPCVKIDLSTRPIDGKNVWDTMELWAAWTTCPRTTP